MSNPFRIELTSPTRLFDGQYSWAHPRAGAIPPGQGGYTGAAPLVVMTLQTIDLDQSDYFSGLYGMETSDLGANWSGPIAIPSFAREELGNGRAQVVCDFTPHWHGGAQRLIGLGHTAHYQGRHVMPSPRPREIAYAFYDVASRSWRPWKKLELPGLPRFAISGAGSAQAVDTPEGDLLVPIYFTPPESDLLWTTVLRCRVEGEALVCLEHGSEHTIPVVRGLYEPSVTRYAGRYYLTMRNDKSGYVAVSDDGLHYSDPVPWCWEDGTDIGNYNTQQHWITHPRHGLFLAYTRRGAENDNVFRHRAPLFMARVDPDTLRLVRETEVALMPNRGARLGNFAVAQVSDTETWVSDAEWMQPRGCEKDGADGSVWVTRIHWDA